MEEKDFTLIDDYFNGLLDAASEDAVRTRAQIDPSFGKEFQLRLQMQDWLESDPARNQFKSQLETLGKEYFKEDSSGPKMSVQRSGAVNWNLFARMAAAIALIAAALWFFNRPQGNLYRQYAQYTPLSLTQRSAGGTLAAEAEKAFNAQKYAEALPLLEQLSAADATATDLALYRALCLIELQRSAEARTLLQPIAAGTSVYKDDAAWYMALSYLNEKDKESCKKALEAIQEGSVHFAKAQEMLQGGL